MTIQEVYDHYQLMPNLQLHQYRVAGVAKCICDSLKETDTVDTGNVVKACLLHDMGNILKFDLGQFPEFLEPQGLAYWQQIQADFRQKYGDKVHAATLQIAHELNVSERVIELIKAIGYSVAQAAYESGDLAKMICEYADCRVTPFGVVSLEDRFIDLEHRYAPLYPGEEAARKREEFRQWERKIEKYIFDRAEIKPQEIVNSTVEAEFENLTKTNYQI
jgi:hypothetical protein